MKFIDFSKFSTARRQPVEGVIIHCTAGSSIQGTLDTLVKRELSYHYIVPKAGEVIKLVPYSRTAWHAGNSYGWVEERNGVSREQNRKAEFTARCSVNGYTVGISLQNLNNGLDPYTEHQISETRALIAALKTGIPSLRFVSGHLDVSPGRKSDPWRLDLQRHFGDLLTVWKPK